MVASLWRALGLWSNARVSEPSPKAGPGRDLLHTLPPSLAGLHCFSAPSPNWQNLVLKKEEGSQLYINWDEIIRPPSTPRGIRVEENVSFQEVGPESQWSFHLGFILWRWASSSFVRWCNELTHSFFWLSVKRVSSSKIYENKRYFFQLWVQSIHENMFGAISCKVHILTQMKCGSSYGPVLVKTYWKTSFGEMLRILYL